MGDARRVWAKSHGFSQEMLTDYRRGLEWILGDPRFTAPGFTPPAAVQVAFKILRMMEAELIKAMAQGPSYEPRLDLTASLALSQVREFFPPEWVQFMERMGMPPTQLTDELVASWEPILEKGLVLRNGDVLSNHPWTLSDPVWALLLPSYIALMLDPTLKPPFGTTPAWIKIEDAQSLSLALCGDWACPPFAEVGGLCCAPDRVMEQIGKLGADYTVHLGDVYPLGSRQFYGAFLERWQPGRRGAFTVCSNHDMYGHAAGYFLDAMMHPMFAAQQGTSYFAVEFGDWIIVGLDSAYHDMSPLFVKGMVRDPDQRAFLLRVREQVERTGQKTFLMLHHTVLSEDGTSTTTVWDDIVGEDALGRAPDVCYTGHLHAGVVYGPDAATGPATKVRVMGHGALPFGAPDVLAQNAGPGKPVQHYAHTPFPDTFPAHRGLAMNGFAAVTLGHDGSLTERFINLDGSDMCT